MAIIRTTNPSLYVTVAAIAVCVWALAVDFVNGVRCVTATLWGDYLEDRRARRARPEPSPVALDPPRDELDHVIDDTIAREIGQPVWLWGSVLVLIIVILVIDVSNSWPAVEQWIGWLAIMARA